MTENCTVAKKTNNNFAFLYHIFDTHFVVIHIMYTVKVYLYISDIFKGPQQRIFKYFNVT